MAQILGSKTCQERHRREAAIAQPPDIEPWMALEDLRMAAPRYHGSHRPMGGGMKSDAICLVCPAHLTLPSLGWWVATIPRSGNHFSWPAHLGRRGFGAASGGPWANVPSFRHDGTTLQEMRRGLPDDPGALGTSSSACSSTTAQDVA